MPPRFAYWTILIDNTPTAFRAQYQEDLLPTLAQLRRTNKDVVMKWFARGRLWESQEAARAAAQKPRLAEKRGREWRPGGEHKDPRARFDKRNKDRRPPRSHKPAPPGVVQALRPAPSKPAYPKAAGFRPAHSISGPGDQRRPWSGKKPGGAQGQRPWKDKPRDRKPWSDRGLKTFDSRLKPEDPDIKPKT